MCILHIRHVTPSIIICSYRACAIRIVEKWARSQFLSLAVSLSSSLRSTERTRRYKLLKLHEPNMFKVMALKPQSMCVFVNALVVGLLWALREIEKEGRAVEINSSHEWLDTFPIVYSRLVDSFGSLAIGKALFNQRLKCGANFGV